MFSTFLKILFSVSPYSNLTGGTAKDGEIQTLVGEGKVTELALCEWPVFGVAWGVSLQFWQPTLLQ